MNFLNRFVLSLFLATSLLVSPLVLTGYAQSSAVLTNDSQKQEIFNKAYWASQPPEVRNLATFPAFSEDRLQLATDLATRGFRIDMNIMVAGYQPYTTMKLRKMYGYTWVPSLLMPPIKIAPGIVIPLAPREDHYDPDNPPVGSLKVSLDVADFPPFDVVVVPPVVELKENPVGMNIRDNMFFAMENKLPHGAKHTDERGTFSKVVILTPFGSSQYWTKQ